MNKQDSKPLDKKDLQELEQTDLSQVTGGAATLDSLQSTTLPQNPDGTLAEAIALRGSP